MGGSKQNQSFDDKNPDHCGQPLAAEKDSQQKEQEEKEQGHLNGFLQEGCEMTCEVPHIHHKAQLGQIASCLQVANTVAEERFESGFDIKRDPDRKSTRLNSSHR